LILVARLFRGDDLGGLDDRRGTGSDGLCDSLLKCLELLFDLADDLLAEFPDVSEPKRVNGIEPGEELRERVLVRVDGRIGLVERKAWRFGTLDGGKRTSGEGEGALEGPKGPGNLGNGSNDPGSSALDCAGPVTFTRLLGRI